MTSIPFTGAAAGAFASLSDILQPVAAGIVKRLPELRASEQVVDLGCGPGEPGLSVLERFPDVGLIGVDRSSDMLAIARTRLADRRGVRFIEGDLEALDLPADSADAVVSRFGFLLAEDTDRSAAEFARIARPGAAFSLAVWDRPELNTVPHVMRTALRGLSDESSLQGFDEVYRRGAAGIPASALRRIAVTELHSELFEWSVRTDLDRLWSTYVGPGPFRTAVDSLDEGDLDLVRERVIDLLVPHRTDGDDYLLPIACRLLWGRR